jgi:hypothetical protein
MESEIFLSLFQPKWLKGLLSDKKTVSFGQYLIALVLKNRL